MSFESPRRKAFLGIALGAASLASSIIGGISSRKQAKEQARLEQRRMELEEFKQASANASKFGLATANALDNQGYVDELKSRVTFRNGGSIGSNTGGGVSPFDLASAGVNLGFGIYNLLNPIKSPEPRAGIEGREYEAVGKNNLEQGVDNLALQQQPSFQEPRYYRPLNRMGGRFRLIRS